MRFNLQIVIAFSVLAKSYRTISILLHFYYKSITFIGKCYFIPVKEILQND